MTRRTSGKCAVLLILATALFPACRGEESPAHKYHAEKERESHHTDGHGDHDTGHAGGTEHHREREGREGKAVTAADEDLGIRLSPAALKTIGVMTVPVKRFAAGRNTFRVPVDSLVFHERETGIYVRRGPWFLLVPSRVKRHDGHISIIETTGIRDGDLVVTAGAALLRLAHLEAFGASGHGHGH